MFPTVSSVQGTDSFSTVGRIGGHTELKAADAMFPTVSDWGRIGLTVGKLRDFLKLPDVSQFLTRLESGGRP